MSKEIDDKQNIEEIENVSEGFRETLATAEESGKRKWVFAKKPKGKFTRYRDIVAAFLLVILFVCPFITLPNGNTIFKFDILNREFYIFGAYFAPSDFYLFAIGLITSIVFIIVFTVIYGRLFCGWICPQTIFMENIFRKIEYLIDGDRNKQIRLDKQGWDSEKIGKRLLKWTIFAFIAFIISNLLFSYVLGIEEVYDIYKNPSNNATVITVLFVFTVLFYFVFSWFREQVCTFVCPYGRLQGVLVDKDTINITYDFIRGESTEGRAKWRKNEDRKALGKGDCIDCDQCVVVCPTGIDIRNGTQLECINCTTCIDACDEVMTKINFPTGLIRYASENMIVNRTEFKFTPRIIAYTVVLTILISALLSLLFIRSNVETKFLKERGTTFEIVEGNIVDNYIFIFINKTAESRKLTVKVLEPKSAGIILSGYGNTFTIEPKGTIKGKAIIKIPESNLTKTKEIITLGIFDDKGNQVDTYKVTFIGPLKIEF